MIIKAPNPILTQKARPVGKIDANIRRIISQMKEALAQSKIGVGLAAPQIGYPLQIFIIAHKSHKPLVFINPKIISKATIATRTEMKSPRAEPVVSFTNLSARADDLGDFSAKVEGCLSLPNVWGKVNRAHPLKLKYLNQKGERKQRTFRGFLTAIIQHEVDHLNGILFTEHVLSQGEKLYRQIKDKKTGKVVMKEIEI